MQKNLGINIRQCIFDLIQHQDSKCYLFFPFFYEQAKKNICNMIKLTLQILLLFLLVIPSIAIIKTVTTFAPKPKTVRDCKGKKQFIIKTKISFVGKSKSHWTLQTQKDICSRNTMREYSYPIPETQNKEPSVLHVSKI